MGQSADVVKIERVSGVVWAGNVSVGPMRGLLQVVRRGMRNCGTGSAASLQGEVKFGGAEFEIIPPFTFRIETEGSNRQQVAAGRGVGEIKNVLGRRQTLVGIGGIAGLVEVVAERKRRGDASSEIRADERAAADQVELWKQRKERR